MGMWLLGAAGHSDPFWKLSSGKFGGPAEEKTKEHLSQQLLGVGRGTLWMLHTLECHLLAQDSVGCRSWVFTLLT